MTYWLLTTEYPPFFGGGISTYCYFTAKMLTEQGYAVSVFINDSSVQKINVETREGVRIIRFNPSRTGSDYFLGHVTNISYEFAQIVKHFVEKEGAPSIIEAQEYLGIAYYLLQFKHLQYDWCKEIPVLITMHSPSFLYMRYNHISEYQYPNYWICEMERSCLQAADHLVSPSHYILEELKKYFSLTQKNIDVVPNPYAVEEGQSIASEGNEIVFFGKLTAQKGAFELLAYFDALWHKGFSESLYLIGGQDIVYHPEGLTMGDLLRKKYKKYIEEGKLILEDRVPPSERAQRLANAKMVIIPSNNDNLPYVVLEMMSLGKIVLTSIQGGQSEVITDGEDGFLFDHEEPKTFEESIHKILQLTPAAVNSISEAAKKRVSYAYSLTAIFKQKEPILLSLNTAAPQQREFPFIRNITNSSAPVSVITPTSHLLSIVVPYYNMGNYIDQTIASLQKSDYQEKEILIINDGSTEEASLAKLEKYRSQKEVKVIDIPNQGLAHARNFGAQLATGEYLAFLDADDVVEASYYSKAIKVLRYRTNVSFVGAWTQYFEGSNKIWPTFNPEPPVILYHNTVNSSALVYKRQAFLQAGLNDSQMTFTGWEDYESVIALTAKGFRGVVLPEPLFQYRVRKNSMIRSVSANKKLFLIQYITKKHKSLYATFATEITNLLQANGPGYKLDNPSLDYKLYVGNAFLNKVVSKAVIIAKKNPALKKAALAVFKKMKS